MAYNEKHFCNYGIYSIVSHSLKSFFDDFMQLTTKGSLHFFFSLS